MERLAKSAHTGHPWRVHDVASDFEVEDVWAFRVPGAGPDDFRAVLEAIRSSGGIDRMSPPTRFLFAVRWRLGALFGWDDPESGVDARKASIRHRLPDDLRTAPRGPDHASMPLKAVYETDTEALRELVNRTAHALMHLGWVPRDDGGHELRMAVLVKTDGRLGRLYMAAIAPFRHLIVYPALGRQWERAWAERDRVAERRDERGGS
ncbi:DUF2867 domain-containing protein [Nocardiopsis sp. N85]|uniref:DUF2867 domain-containing protein n=1 Tax=Nocardiopsis sp. N85 TaxID=3029400 RepID=UPI00237EEE00|nr:DUF2867 domain-containing protein [Nocardiopsis sp. N85]MDE3725034.1 DUF2867 domain-containing protein [Nocardiopsis sp. N85]